MYKTNDIFSKIDKMFCAEQEAEYQQEKIVPFYHNPDKKIKLFQGDSLSILKKAPDDCIDMIFADPPYFGNQSGLIIKRNDGHADTFDTQKQHGLILNPLIINLNFIIHG
jgi:hypothetical protein